MIGPFYGGLLTCCHYKSKLIFISIYVSQYFDTEIFWLARVTTIVIAFLLSHLIIFHFIKNLSEWNKKLMMRIITHASSFFQLEVPYEKGCMFRLVFLIFIFFYEIAWLRSVPSRIYIFMLWNNGKKGTQRAHIFHY